MTDGGALVTDDDLVAEAIAARAHAYAPYSQFAVGAAVVGESGRVYRGCNVENASYPLCVCAERVAINNAVSAGERRVMRLAVVTDTSPPASPCGGCRQVIFEFGGPECMVTFGNTRGERRRMLARELLPEGFDGSTLRR